MLLGTMLHWCPHEELDNLIIELDNLIGFFSSWGWSKAWDLFVTMTCFSAHLAALPFLPQKVPSHWLCLPSHWESNRTIMSKGRGKFRIMPPSFFVIVCLPLCHTHTEDDWCNKHKTHKGESHSYGSCFTPSIFHQPLDKTWNLLLMQIFFF